MLQEVIRANIETKLNANTTALVTSPSNNVLFVVGQYFKDETDNYDFIYNIENGYKTIDATYVPVSMRFTADYRPLYGTKSGSAIINLDFMVAIDNDYDSKISAIDSLVSLVVANSEDVVDGAVTYHTVWNMSAFTDKGQIYYFNGTKFIIITTTVYIEFSDTYHYGNEWTVALDEHDINYLSFKSEVGGEEDLPQVLGQAEAKGGIKTNSRTFTLTCFVDDYISAVIDGWETAFNQETVHQLALETPTYATHIDVSVVLKDRVYNLEKGEIVSVTMVFVVSDVAYTEPQFTITYNLNGGTNNISNPATFDDDDVPVTLLAPTRTGATFDGWYYDAQFTETVTTISTLANTTVYAKWILTTYTVTYNLDGGTNHVSNPATFDVEDLPITLLDATKAFYVFSGWWTGAGGTGTEVSAITTIGNKTLYAYWTE